MSDDLGDFFALPAFKPQEALVGLRRQLRELKPLAEKTGTEPHRFELRGLPVIELSLDDGDTAIRARWAQRLSQRPDWRQTLLKSSAEVRRFADDMKRQLTRWEDED